MVREFLKEIKSITDRSISCVVIFDGPAPEEKDYAKDRRTKAKSNAKEDLKFLSKAVTEDKSLTDVYMKALSRCYSVCEDDIFALRQSLSCSGIPNFEARGEGDPLCAILVKLGWAAAVYTKDTDVLALGCPVMIHSIAYGKASITWLDLFMKKFPHDRNTFIDLCILAGCDYNTNVPGYRIKKSYALMKKIDATSIEQLASHNPIFNSEQLNTQFCRNYFTTEHQPYARTKNGFALLTPKNMKSVIRSHPIPMTLRDQQEEIEELRESIKTHCMNPGFHRLIIST